MPQKLASAQVLDSILDRINVGVFVLNKAMQVVFWNHFMEINSKKTVDEVLGKHIVDVFPELPKQWLERKVQGVFVLKNFAFTSWEQRPYLLKFPHNRPVTGGVDHMRQNCTFMPVKNDLGEVEHVCVVLTDVTDTSIEYNKAQDALTKLAEASNRDGLTGIYNRRYLEQTLTKEFSRVKRYEGSLSFILLDLDHFKAINDEKGHLAGDEVLRRVAEVLTTCVREADTLGRYGGEEFAIILPQTRLKGALILAERVRHDVEEAAIQLRDDTVKVTVSIGVTQMHPETPVYERLIQEADTALYQSKQLGRNRVTCFQRATVPGSF